MIKITFLTIVCMISTLGAEKLPFQISSPSDREYRKVTAGIKLKISDQVATLIDHLREPKDGGYIDVNGSASPLKWRVESMTFINSDLVAVSFTEGHVVVDAIYWRNSKADRWEPKCEIGGKISVKNLADPEKKK